MQQKQVNGGNVGAQSKNSNMMNNGDHVPNRLNGQQISAKNTKVELEVGQQKMNEANEGSKPPIQTFENPSFNELLAKEGRPAKPTVELAQAFIMSNNFKEAAAITNGSQILNGGSTNGTDISTAAVAGEKVGSAPSAIDTG